MIPARAFLLALLLALLVGLAAACAPMGASGDSVAFRVETNVPDAMVWVDDHLVGSVTSLSTSGSRLRVGFHRVEVRHPTHYPFFKEVEPKKGEEVVIRAELHDVCRPVPLCAAC